MNTELTKIQQKLSDLSLEKLAMTHQFYKRAGSAKYKITDLVISFFEMFLDGGNTLSCWAKKIADRSGWLLSKQGLSQRLSDSVQSICKALLNEAINLQAIDNEAIYASEIFSSFEAVYLEDSSCFSLPDNLASTFPGSYSKRLKGPAATAKIQLRMNLLDEQYTAVEVSSFRQNDQSYAAAIVSELKPGDLVLRDLGYWSLSVMEAICQKGAFLLSRYRYKTGLLDPDSQEEIKLNRYLKQQLKKGNKTIDTMVLVGKDQQLPLRLVAFKAPPDVEEARKRKAQNDRNKKANHHQDYFDLLGWTIYLTNVPVEVWSPDQVMKAYGFRWRIEMVFKCWKSSLNMDKLFANKKSMTPQRVYISLYLVLLWLVLFFTSWMIYFAKVLLEKHNRFLSQAKFAGFVREKLKQLNQAEDLDQFIPWLIKYCCYDKRVKRKNQIELLCLDSLA